MGATIRANRREDTMPDVGDMAPDFTLRNTHGDEIRLSDRRGRARVVLIFYPGDLTTG
jgi:peroxiredoxin